MAPEPKELDRHSTEPGEPGMVDLGKLCSGRIRDARIGYK